MKTKRYFLLIYTVAVAIFVTCILPYLPFALFWGWMPSYILIYMIVLAVCSIVWGRFISKFLDTQPDE